jgi:inner membrane transporter RhtA
VGGPEPVAGVAGSGPAGLGPAVSGSRYAGAVGLFILGAITQYVGAALAVGLFQVMPAPTMAWWRIAIAALVLLAWRRPWRSVRGREAWGAAALFGLCYDLMNVRLHRDRHIPHGTAVSPTSLWGP